VITGMRRVVRSRNPLEARIDRGILVIGLGLRDGCARVQLSVRPERIAENFDAFSFDLGSDDMDAIAT
jgi:hypothetical protein